MLHACQAGHINVFQSSMSQEIVELLSVLGAGQETADDDHLLGLGKSQLGARKNLGQHDFKLL